MFDDLRSFYAEFVVAKAGSTSPGLIKAFRSVDRRLYVGDGPWKVFTPAGYIETPAAEMSIIWQDVSIALDATKNINNGEPSLHALCLSALAPCAGERVVQVGAGSGYYTAILAELVGSTGAIDAYEIDAKLAAKAADNLKVYPHVQLHASSALEGSLPSADIVYVNAGASYPARSWLDSLGLGGRLLFPLTTKTGIGVMLLVTRRNGPVFEARVIAGVGFIPCLGVRDDCLSDALAAALSLGTARDIRSLHRDSAPDASAWLIGDRWWLSVREVVDNEPSRMARVGC
jgi:protein-L-isoaspartate(D-aspartate) O-methyltransferase